jgi:hypothetical protein
LEKYGGEALSYAREFEPGRDGCHPLRSGISKRERIGADGPNEQGGASFRGFAYRNADEFAARDPNGNACRLYSEPEDTVTAKPDNNYDAEAKPEYKPGSRTFKPTVQPCDNSNGGNEPERHDTAFGRQHSQGKLTGQRSVIRRRCDDGRRSRCRSLPNRYHSHGSAAHLHADTNSKANANSNSNAGVGTALLTV